MNAPDRSQRPRRLARAFARRSGLAAGRAVHRGAIRPRHRDAESQAPAITTTALAGAYRQRILAALPAHSRFEPLMTLYLTDQTPPEEIDRRHEQRIRPWRETLSRREPPRTREAGVTDIAQAYARARAHAKDRHAASRAWRVRATGRRRVRPRDALHRRTCWRRCSNDLAALQRGVRAHHHGARGGIRRAARARLVAATITPQHLLHNRNAIFSGGIRPHFYCLPILKRERDRKRCVRPRPAATRATSWARTAHRTSAAPRKRLAAARACSRRMQPSSCTQRRSNRPGSLDRLEGFASHFGADFYGLPRHAEHDHAAQGNLDRAAAVTNSAAARCVPYRAGEPIGWRLLPASSHDRSCRRSPLRRASADFCPWSSTSKPAVSTRRPTRCWKSPPYSSRCAATARSRAARRTATT